MSSSQEEPKSSPLPDGDTPAGEAEGERLEIARRIALDTLAADHQRLEVDGKFAFRAVGT